MGKRWKHINWCGTGETLSGKVPVGGKLVSCAVDPDGVKWALLVGAVKTSPKSGTWRNFKLVGDLVMHKANYRLGASLDGSRIVEGDDAILLRETRPLLWDWVVAELSGFERLTPSEVPVVWLGHGWLDDEIEAAGGMMTLPRAEVDAAFAKDPVMIAQVFQCLRNIPRRIFDASAGTSQAPLE